MIEFTEPLFVADLITALQQLPPSYRACVNGCRGGTYEITQIDVDDRGFIELYTFNSNEHSENHIRRREPVGLGESYAVFKRTMDSNG